MSMTTNPNSTATRQQVLEIVPLAHPQGCRAYLVACRETGTAMAVDVHLDLVDAVSERLTSEGWHLQAVVDTHTHADHPSGSAALAERFGARRLAHALAHHRGTSYHPADGEEIAVGHGSVIVRHAPGHTPDHLVLLTGDALLAGDTLLIGGVARTDFLGGDAGQLHDTLGRLLDGLSDDITVYPGHDYEGRISSTIGKERATNPWLAVDSRAEFVRLLNANPPPRPANMDDLLRLNREGEPIPAVIDVATTVARVAGGGAGSIIDVRMGMEWEAEHVPGSRHVPLDELERRADEVRMTPAPRLLLCQTGSRARSAAQLLAAAHVRGLSVIDGGLIAFRTAGGPTVLGRQTMSLERQVRIAAGSLVVTGVVLSLLHPAFLLLSAFVGSGLVFAGVTDRCGMSAVLGKLPWNRVTGTPGQGGQPASACAASAPPPAACAASAPPPAACTASAPPPAACAASPPPKV